MRLKFDSPKNTFRGAFFYNYDRTQQTMKDYAYKGSSRTGLYRISSFLSVLKSHIGIILPFRLSLC